MLFWLGLALVFLVPAVFCLPFAVHAHDLMYFTLLFCYSINVFVDDFAISWRLIQFPWHIFHMVLVLWNIDNLPFLKVNLSLVQYSQLVLIPWSLIKSGNYCHFNDNTLVFQLCFMLTMYPATYGISVLRCNATKTFNYNFNFNSIFLSWY